MSSSKNKYLVPALALGAGVGLGAAWFFWKRQPKPTFISEVEYLNKELCEKRRKLISSQHVEYDILLVFPDKEDFYFGEIEIKFDLAEQEDLTLDFQKKGVVEMAINRKTVTDPKNLISSDQIVLPKSFLAVGENLVQIKFKNQFDKNCYGLIKGDDGTIHAITCGYLPSLIFPCFDQPNIKSTLKLRAILNKTLKAIANEKATGEGSIGNSDYFAADARENYKIVEFARTKILPIHNFTFYAGYFESIKAKRIWKAVPIHFYCRSHVKPILAEKIANLEVVVHKTLDYFYQHFDSKYPFSKLDIVYTESTAPAIEYPGAILINEQFLLENDLYTRTESLVILCHEIIHMWFGNITTCDYWDNLFLHEAFANYVSVIIYNSFYKDLQGSFQEPTQYFLINKTRSSLLHAHLPGAHAIKSDLNELELANTAFDHVTYNKGEYWLYYFHDQWKDHFVTLLKRMIKSEPWSNLTYQNFLDFVPEGQRGKFKLALENKLNDVLKIEATETPKKFTITRVQSSGLTFENIGVTFYDLNSSEVKVERVDIVGQEIHFSAPAEMTDFVFVFNQSAKAFCIWKDCPKNAELIVSNMGKLPDNEVLNYYLNIANYYLIRAEDPEILMHVFKAAYQTIKKSNDRTLIKMLKRVLVHKAKQHAHSNEIYQFLMDRNDCSFALYFMTNQIQGEHFIEYLNKYLLDNQHVWKEFICRANKLGLKDLHDQALKDYELKFKDEEFAKLRSTCSNEVLENEFMSLIMYRTGNKNIKHYLNLLRFMKSYLPEEKRVQLAIKFMADFHSISKQVSKFYIQGIFKLVVPAVRTQKFEALNFEFAKAAGQVSTQPLLSRVLSERIQLLKLYND